MGGEGAEALSPDGAALIPVDDGPAVSGFYIEGLSDKPFREVADLLLAHPSILPTHGIQLAFAGRHLFGPRLFLHAGPLFIPLYSILKKTLIEIGNNIMIGMDYDQFCGVPAKDYMFIFSNQAAAWALIVYDLWAAAHRLVVLIEGPAEFTPAAYHLRDIKPVFGPSTELARFLRDATDLDATAGVNYANEILSRYFQPIERPFPRIRNLEAQLTSEL